MHQRPSNEVCCLLACIERQIKLFGDVTVVYDDQGRRGIVCEPDCRGSGVEMVECSCCGGSGFSTPGTGYDNVCSECGGQRLVVKRAASETRDAYIAALKAADNHDFTSLLAFARS
jgi:hypothetical protein